MGKINDSIPPNTIVIDICVYCADCKYVHRVAEPDDRSGGFESCPECNTPTQTIIGVHIAAGDEILLQAAQRYVQQSKITKKLEKILRNWL